MDKFKLDGHMAVRHGGSRQFVCAICSKEYAYNSALKNHMQTTHDSTKYNAT